MITYKFDPTANYLAAVSYGPDSMAMLDMLIKKGTNVVVCALNYHSFEGSDADFFALQIYCEAKKIRFEGLDTAELPEEEKMKEGQSFSDWSRTVRYAFFKKMYDKYNAAGLLIGHNQDDLIETYLMQRNRNLKSAHYGLSETTVRMGMLVIRPLLNYSREDLLAYNAENHVPYSMLFSRFQDEHMRNPLRQDVIAHMSEIDRDNLIREMEAKNSETRELISDVAEDIASGDELEIRVLIALPPDEFAGALLRFVQTFSNCPSLTPEEIANIRKMCLAPQPNLSLKLRKGECYIVKEYDILTVGRGDPKSLPYTYVLEAPGELHTEQFDLDFSMGAEDRGIKPEDYPLTIRSALPADTYVVHGYLEKVRALYSTWKMPVAIRALWPVFISKTGKIIYVPRYRTQFREYHTSVLKLHIDPDIA